MNGNVILRMVGDIDEDLISFSDINGRSWEHPIYCNNWFGMAEPAHILHLNLRPREAEEQLVYISVCRCKKDHE